MTTPITTEQWQAMRAQMMAQGPYSQQQCDLEIAKLYSIATPTPPAPPVPAATTAGPPAAQQQHRGRAPDLTGSDFGVGEGRTPGDGYHIVRGVEMFEKPNGFYGPKYIIRYSMVESQAADSEIGGEYSKGYALDAKEGFGKPLAELKGIMADLIDHRHPEWACRTNWTRETNDRYCDYVIGPEQPVAGVTYLLRTEQRQSTKSEFSWTKHEWKIVPDGSTLASLGVGKPKAAAAPAIPPMPASSVPAMPPAPSSPTLPVAALPPMPGAPTTPPALPPPSVPNDGRPPGWNGAWPP